MGSVRHEKIHRGNEPPPVLRHWIASEILRENLAEFLSGLSFHTTEGLPGKKEKGSPDEWDPFLDGVLRGTLSYCGPLPENLSPFDRKVLEETRKISFGETMTYGELAKRIGKPRAARAVGGSLGRNPLPLLIPCHRVVGRGGVLTGYSQGIAIKEALLAWERRAIAP